MITSNEMTRRTRVLLVLILALSITVSLVVSGARADYALTVTQNGVAVHISGDFLQGTATNKQNTTVRIFGNFPAFTGHFSGTNSSGLTGLLNKSITRDSPQATVSGVKLDIISNGTNLHYNLTFTVGGVFSKASNFDKVDLTWRSIIINDDFLVSSASVNKLFPRYLAPTLLQLLAASSSGPPGITVTKFLYLNNQFIPPGQASGVTSDLLLFNFSSLNRPLQTWNIARDLGSSSIRLRASTGFNMTFLQTFNEAGETSSLNVNAVYNLGATIDAPYAVYISNNEMRFETGSVVGIYEIMLAIIVLCPVTFLSTLLYERRLQKLRPSGTKRSRT